MLSALDPDLMAQLQGAANTAACAPELWVLGTHGGGGESSLVQMVQATVGQPIWREANHQWPTSGSVLLCCRTNARGLISAHEALAGIAAGQHQGVYVAGLAIIADSPKKIASKYLRDMQRLVEAGIDHVWQIGWSEAWRCGDYSHTPPDGAPALIKALTKETDHG